MKKYKAIEETLRILQDFCISEMKKERNLNDPEDYIIYQTLSEGFSGIIRIKSYIDYQIFESTGEEIPKNKKIIIDNKNCNKTIN